MDGILHLCATPIGNLEDITIRVLNTLKNVDLIAAEDTRHSRGLLTHFEINTPITSYHEHNKNEKTPYLINKLKNGEDIALITDAGVPAISDPGEDLVRACYENGIKVTSLPGACALITGLTLSGLSTRRFKFEGFLPSSKKERMVVLDNVKNEVGTIIFYEAPHRLVKTLEELLLIIGDRNMTLCRELTKKFETVMPGKISDIIEFYKGKDVKGECVLVIDGKTFEMIKEEEKDKWSDMSIEQHFEYYINKGIDKKESIKLVAKDRGVSKRDIYNYLL